MCLYIKPYARRRIAKKDIPIYKEVILGSCKWVTPYMEIEIPEDGVLTPIEKFDHIPTRDDGYYSRCIEGGAIHCYKKPFLRGDFFKGIIPKDTEYYVSDEGGEYAAMKIVLDMSRVISYP
jgi:hypothetical protein